MSMRAGDVAQYFTVLGLQPGATFKDVEHAYRSLVKAWHPDHFTHDPQLRHTAQEKLKLINIACDFLRAHQDEVEALAVAARAQAEAAAEEQRRRQQQQAEAEQLRGRQQARAEREYRRREQERLAEARRQPLAPHQDDQPDQPFYAARRRQTIRERSGRVTPWYANWDRVPAPPKLAPSALRGWMMAGLIVGLTWGIFHAHPLGDQGIDVATAGVIAARFALHVFGSMAAGALTGLALAGAWKHFKPG